MATVSTPPPKTRSQTAAREAAARPAPVMKVTRYDLVTSLMVAIILGLVLGVLWLMAVWFTNKLPEAEGLAELEIVDIAGGEEDGAPDEELMVESPEEPVKDPHVEEVLEQVVELSTQMADMQPPSEPRAGTQTGSKVGTGRSPLGSGGGSGSAGREQRWFIKFSDDTLDVYARQLDHFGIELGALMPGKIVYLSNLSAAKPTSRTVTTGGNENRMYMTWRGGNRRIADTKLFQKAGIDVAGAVIFHFYPKNTEQQLAQLERDYARGRPSNQIQRTYYTVRSDGAGFRFLVSKQSYFR